MANKKSSSSGSTSKSTSKANTKAKKTAQKQAVTYAKNHKKAIAIAVCVLLIIVVLAVLFVYLFKRDTFDAYLSDVKDYYFDSKDDDPEGTIAKVSEPVEAGDLTGITGSEFSIHFLELGNKYAGDATLIKCGDTEVLIDAGSRTNSATTIKAYVDQYCTDGKLEYVVATHAHQDHIAGFVGANSNGGAPKTGILYQYEIGTIIQFAGHNSNANIYKNYVAATEYAKNNGATVYDAKQCWYETDGAKKSYDLSVAQDGSLTLNVLYNYYYENETDDENDYSVCLLLTHKSATKTSHYLFTGDLEGKGEGYLVDRNELPEVELFKGGHHGSKTSTTDKLLKKIKPKNIAVCCCAGATEYTSNNDNTFPTQAFVDRISAYTDNVYCTSLCINYKGNEFVSMNGNIVFYVKESQLKLWCSNSYDKLKDWDWFKENRKCPKPWQ